MDFTDVNYAFSGETRIVDLPAPTDFETWFATTDGLPDADCDRWRTDPSLPATIEGVVTIYPRLYMKVPGCRPSDDFDVDSDEKYFGSFYIQDESGGHLVLGDTRVTHFDRGDRVRLQVRSIKEYFGSTMVVAHDVRNIDRANAPIYYRTVEDRLLDDNDRATVVRVQGIVAGPMSNFGEIYLCTGDDPDTTMVVDQGRFNDLVPACARSDVQDPPWYKISLDVELQRRGYELEPGTLMEATGPAHLSFGDYQVVLMQVGQFRCSRNGVWDPDYCRALPDSAENAK